MSLCVVSVSNYYFEKNMRILSIQTYCLFLVAILFCACQEEPHISEDPNQGQGQQEVDPSRDPSVVAQEAALLKLLGKESGIAFSTTMQPGDTISIGLEARGALQIEGMEPSQYPSRYPDKKEWTCYTITDTAVVVKGDVRTLKLLKMPIKAIVTSQAPNLEQCAIVMSSPLSELDLSHNKQLQSIDMSHVRQLRWIALPQSPTFKMCDLSDCSSLSKIDFTGCEKIEAIDLTNTAVSQLDLTNNVELRILYLARTPCPLPSLKHLKHLEDLWIEEKGLFTLDVTDLPESLIFLNIRCNRVSGVLDLSHLKKLEMCTCNDNLITELKLHHVPTQLWAHNNQLTQIEVLTNETPDYVKWSEELEGLPCLSLYNNRLSSEVTSRLASKLFVIEKPTFGMAIIASRASSFEKYSFSGNSFDPTTLEEIKSKGWQLWGITTNEFGGGGMDPISY